jgi:hypothetical protein
MKFESGSRITIDDYGLWLSRKEETIAVAQMVSPGRSNFFEGTSVGWNRFPDFKNVYMSIMTFLFIRMAMKDLWR